MKPTSLHLTEPCRRISALLAQIGDKWTLLVVRDLSDGPRRFSEIRRALGSISQKMLTTTLRALERNGFVTRTVYPTVPPRVDYALTSLGRDLLEPVSALSEWALKNAERVERAQRTFDATHGQPAKANGRSHGHTAGEARRVS
ncbi:MAG TPA: helix-turn-helix domain-containing protein [Bauldia sp.]|nr:helix-turn-helix domain-containing protein [Bauldia sp.]